MPAVRADLKCKACGETRNYSTKEVVYDQLVCKSCGAPIKVVINLDEVNADYVSVNGTTQRRKAKIRMSKKARRRQRAEDVSLG